MTKLRQPFEVLISLNERQFYIFLKFEEPKKPIQFELSYMSIYNCQAIQKSCIDMVYARLTEHYLGFKLTAVTIFKLLNDRQSEFRESSELIMYKQYVNWEVSSRPKKIRYYKYENMQDSKIVTAKSYVRVSCGREAWRLLLAGNF